MTIKLISAFVESVAPITDNIIKLVLAPDPFINYQAGQYLQIDVNGKLLSYSIANAPLGSQTYELHIRHDKKSLDNQQLFTHIKQQGQVSIQVPLGHCYLARLQPYLPIIFIAGGTGMAPVKAMIEQLLATNDVRSFELYWGVRSLNDLYLDSRIRQWEADIKQFHYFPLLPTLPQETLSTFMINQHLHDLNKYQFVMAGPFDMVLAMRDALLAAGVSLAHLHSDAFNNFDQL